MASILLTLLVPCLGSRIMSTSDSDPFSGFQLFGPWTASSAGCTSTGWKGKYSIYGGAVEILSLEVGPESTTFTFNSELVSQAQESSEDSFVADWFRMQGPTPNDKVKEFFCNGASVGSVAFRLSIVKACDFWSPASLQSLCPALAQVDSEVDEEIEAKRSDKSNKLAEWFKMEGPQDNDDLTEFFCDDGWATEDMKLLDPAALTWRVNFDGPSLAKRAKEIAAKACSFWSQRSWQKC
ncbi:unnamed protein product [Cladocopium goreaui]|uniref:Uncharacterized protein n=1 Tax=Cladocopium goreaui TaxID=2562237 RepID=A0A9P1CWP7_9DINO|nr:unnamed protein product [Cladocopium goreaui]